MSLEKIKQMLQETIGLHSRSIGDASIERAIRHRMHILNILNDDEYLPLLRSEQSEFDELIEEVVVPETWFFRNTSPFDALGKYISQLKTVKSTGATLPLKILSLPCSTGEEPYSIAMVLMESGRHDLRFSIDALDVSQRAIDKAQLAYYGRNSFREEYRGFKQKYFEQVSSGFQLKSTVKKHVRFARSNIIKDDFTASYRKYDVIFCRNLLIYFDHVTQVEVLKKFHSMLRPGGIIFVGHAESSQVPTHLYESLDIPMAFAFKAIEDSSLISTDKIQKEFSLTEKRSRSLKELRNAFQDLVELTERDQLVGGRISRYHQRKIGKVKNNRVGGTPSLLQNEKTDSQKADDSVAYEDTPLMLEKISHLIEQGKLLVAGELAESYKQDHPESAEAHYYLGLISHFEGGLGSAELLLKRALYLNPKHHSAMGLLSLIAEDRGDVDQAESYRRRQKRIIRNDLVDRKKNV